MPKKRAPTYDAKPSSPAHPSLSSSVKPKDARDEPSLGNSVNDRIQRLRISQGASSSQPGIFGGRPPSQILDPAAGPSLPPSLRSILQLPDVPPPRPRPGLRVAGRARGPAGPAPPVSWQRQREQALGQKSTHGQMHPGRIGAEIERLPGYSLPNHGSLVHMALKALAINWTWHVNYDQYYLATIPVRYKEVLLHYIARYGRGGTDKEGLAVLFLDETELEDATGVDGLTHLDLSTSIGHPLKLKQLKDILVKKPAPSTEETSDVIPESWDMPDINDSLSNLPRFHSLTHLSLSNPNNTATWKELLDLAPHLMTITHLSLAYWPAPMMAPNSVTAYRETPQGNVNVGPSNYYSSLDDDWTEAVSILRRLSKTTYCLKWLDLTGCFPWVQALKSNEIDWCGAWRGLEIVRVGQGYIPECFQENAAETAWRDVYWGGGTPVSHGLPSPDDSYEKKQLLRWVYVEGATMCLENIVNNKISFRMKQASAGRVHEPEMARPQREDFEDWLQNPSAVSVWSRSQRVTFERGWDSSSWIREAIYQIRDMDPNW